MVSRTKTAWQTTPEFSQRKKKKKKKKKKTCKLCNATFKNRNFARHEETKQKQKQISQLILESKNS